MPSAKTATARLAFGGNKTRKLEYLIPEALADGCDTLVSIGGIQSNQTRQVAAVAAHLGMKCVLVQENWVNYSDAVYDRVGNIEMSPHHGRRRPARCRRFRHRHPARAGSRRWKTCAGRAASPTPSPPGCSDHPLGGLGFVGFAEEVRQQEAELGLQVRLHRRLLGHRQHASRHGRRFRRRRPRRPRDRHRRVGQAGADAAQILRIAQHTAELVELGPPDHRRTTWCWTHATAIRNTACRTRARWKPSACARGRRAC